MQKTFVQKTKPKGDALNTAFTSILAGAAASGLILSAASNAQDFTEPASFGTVTLNAGFLPDPHVRNLTAGGAIRAQERFSSCRGYIANAPDYSVYYTAGSAPLIFTVDSDRDTTLVINGPDARWYCDDDGGNGLNPALNFGSPMAGQYDIWVGTYGNASMQSATLHISELYSQ